MTQSDAPDVPSDLAIMTCLEDAPFILSRRPVADTMAQYKQSLEDRVVLTWNLYKVGITLREVNQRYCQLGMRFKVPPSHVAQMLAREGRIKVERYRGSLILLPNDYTEALNQETFQEDLKQICRDTLGK